MKFNNGSYFVRKPFFRQQQNLLAASVSQVLGDPFFKVYCQLSQYLVPVTNLHRPLPRHVLRGKVQQFQQSVVIWKNTSILGDLSQLTMEALYGIGRVD